MNWSKIEYKTVKLEEVCEIIAGQSPPSDTYNTNSIGLPFFQGKADFGVESPNVRMWCSKPQKIAQPQDILLSVRAPVGPTNICNQKSCIGRGLSAIRVGNKVNNRFLLFYFKQIEPVFSKSGVGSTFSAITQSDIKNLQIPLPLLEVQQQIAALLDRADTLRQLDRQLLTHYDTLIQSVFLEMFGDPVKNEKGWEVRELGKLVTIIGGGTPSREIEEYFNGEICWATSKDIKSHYITGTIEHITEDAIKKSATKLVPIGTVLMVVKSKILAHSLPIAISKVPICFGQDLKGIIPNDELNVHFLVHHLKMGKHILLTQARGVNTEGLTLNHLNSFPFIFPPLALQQRFADIVTKIEAQKTTAAAQAEASEALFQGLLQKAFGKH